MILSKTNENSSKNVENVDELDLTENFSKSFIEKNSSDRTKPNLTSENFEVVHSKIMRHPKIILRLFGFYHEKTDGLAIKAYCISMLLIIWFNSLRYFFSFEIIYGRSEKFLSINFLYKLIFITSHPLYATYSTIIFINQEFNNRERMLLDELNSLFQYVKDVETSAKKLSIIIKIIFLLTFTNSTILCFGFIKGVFFSDHLSHNERELVKIHLSPFHRQDWPQNSLSFKIGICIIRSLSGIHASFTVAYFLSYCKILLFLFDDFNRKFQGFILDSQSKTNENEFEKYRLLHLKLVNAVKKMDVCYNQFLGCIIIGSTIGIVIIGYLFSIRSIIIESENSTSTFGYVLLAITFTWLFIYFAADVNTKVGN